MGIRTAVAGMAAGLCMTAGLADAQTVPAADPTREAYSNPQTLADVGSGRKTHLICMGQGSPTVVFTTGLGNWSETWRLVQPAIAKTTRACAWDRAGFGFSSPSPEPQDVVHTTGDLERALKAAHIAGPYVLVGHSLGGYESLLFADRHPRDVLGMVLVDPSVPDQQRVIAEGSPVLASLFNRLYSATVSSLRSCGEKLQSGAQTLGDKAMADCLDSQETAYSPELQANVRRMEADPARFLTESSTMEQFGADSRLIVNPHRNYGAMPLIVLTALRVQALPADASPEETAAYADFQSTTWRKAHDDLAALSTRGQNRLVPDSSHYIHVIKPQLVIDAIDEVVAEARSAANR
jgi:pimeloyl-ACP methyl ester carboxylesterase